MPKFSAENPVKIAIIGAVLSAITIMCPGSGWIRVRG